MNKIYAKKSLGQNFIFDENITDKIASFITNPKSSTILEVGSGPATLTKSILKLNPMKLVCLEKDSRFIENLESLKKENENIEINNQDALDFDYSSIEGNFKIVANLPYNISTVLLIKWLKIADKIDEMILMFQKEVAERIIASPNTKKYSRLSVMAKSVADAHILYNLPPSVFTPAPKVESSVVKIIPKKNKIDLEKLEEFLKIAFAHRRKKLKSNLKDFKGLDNVFQKYEIDENARPENIDIETYIKISNELNN